MEEESGQDLGADRACAEGIGQATALLYAVEGCRRIVIADINADALERVRTQISSQHTSTEVLAVVVDVRSEQSVQKMVDDAIRVFGRIDYCANIAGIIRYGSTTSLTTEDFELVYQINLRGVFFCSKAQINAMLRQEPLHNRHEIHSTP